jgi:hypothetical protein
VVDFEAPSTPRPIRLPAGTGRRFKSAVEETVPALARVSLAEVSNDGSSRGLPTLAC